MRHGGAFELRFMNWIFQIGAPNSKEALANQALRMALVENGLRIRQHADSLPFRQGMTPLKVLPEYEAWLVEAIRSGPESPFWHIKGMSVVDHSGRLRRRPGTAHHGLVRLVDSPGHHELRGAAREPRNRRNGS